MSFCFKQFFVHDELCAMKVGTDGVLLGAWCASANGEWLTANGAILDIGTGSGLISLMLAQRFPDAHILGIDIDENAVQQARQNFADSPWADRLHAEHIALQNFLTFEPSNLPTEQTQFALIVSNPPYFQNSMKNPDAARTTARHTDSLSYEELLSCSAKLLLNHGTLSLILPIEAEQEILTLAAHNGLYLRRLCRVRGNERKPFKRLLIEFQKQESLHEPQTPYEETTLILEETLTLEDAPNQRSTDYARLTQDFYL